MQTISHHKAGVAIYNMFTIPVINIETNYQIIIAEQIATYIYSDHIQLQAGRYFCDPDKL